MVEATREIKLQDRRQMGRLCANRGGLCVAITLSDVIQKSFEYDHPIKHRGNKCLAYRYNRIIDILSQSARQTISDFFPTIESYQNNG